MMVLGGGLRGAVARCRIELPEAQQRQPRHNGDAPCHRGPIICGMRSCETAADSDPDGQASALPQARADGTRCRAGTAGLCDDSAADLSKDAEARHGWQGA